MTNIVSPRGAIQCAAVKTYLLEIKLPPQFCVVPDAVILNKIFVNLQYFFL